MNITNDSLYPAKLSYFSRHPSAGYIIIYTSLFVIFAIVAATVCMRTNTEEILHIAPFIEKTQDSSVPFNEIFKKAVGICSGDIIQISAAAILGFTLIAPQGCALIIAWRGAAAGFAAAASFTAKPDIISMFPVISYFICSIFLIWFCAFTAVFSYKIRPLWGSRQLLKSGYIGAHAICWLCISGAIAVIRLLPYLFI